MNNPAVRLGRWLIRQVFCRETLFALLLCVIVVLVIIVTTDDSPQWIYQGF
jgi:hypothetical protein